jgi:hypothetical protein
MPPDPTIQLMLDTLQTADAGMSHAAVVLNEAKETVLAQRARIEQLEDVCEQVLLAVAISLAVALALAIHAVVPHIVDLMGG